MQEWKLEKYNEFECIGTNCPWTCCGRWKIFIDEESLKRYDAIPGELGEEVRDTVGYDVLGNAFVKLGEGDLCTLLNDKRLCRICLEAGEGSMSNTCQKYPRGEFVFGDIYLKYVCISCPEVVRILFESKEPLRLISEKNNSVSISTDETFNWNKLGRLKEGFRKSIELIQMRNLPLHTRLQLLLLFNDEYTRGLQAGGDVGYIIDTFSDETYVQKMCNGLANIPSNSNKLFRFVMEFNKHIWNQKSHSMKYLTEHMLKAVDEFKSADLTKVSLAEFFDRKDNSVHFENLCVYYIMRHYLESYNDTNPGAVIEEMVRFCAFYAWLFGIYGEERSLETKTVIVAIPSRTTEHCALYSSEYDAVFKIMKEQGIGNLEYLVSMLA